MSKHFRSKEFGFNNMALMDNRDGSYSLGTKQEPQYEVEKINGDFLGSTSSWTNDLTVEEDGTLWAIFSDVVVSRSFNGGKTWERMLTLSRTNTRLGGITVTDKGTIIVTGRSHGTTVRDFIVYRKEQDSVNFTRIETELKTESTIVSSLSSGKIGIVNCFYGGGSKKIEYSIDDGLTWEDSIVPTLDHTHSVHVDQYEDYVYVTTGDSVHGVDTGCHRTTDFINYEHIFEERPGFRVVPVAGNFRLRVLGNEAPGGGVLISYDDKEWEIGFGRITSEYFGFNSLLCTEDGWIIGGTYSYRERGEDPHYGHAGSIWISGDDGRNAVQIPTGAKAVNAFAYHNGYLYCAFGAQSLRFDNVPYLLKIRLPNRTNTLKMPQTTRIFLHDPNNVRPLKIGETTMSTNLAAYSNITLHVESGHNTDAGTLTLQGKLFYEGTDGSQPDIDEWDNLLTVDINGIKRKHLIKLQDGTENYMRYRLKNSGETELKVKFAAITGKD